MRRNETREELAAIIAIMATTRHHDGSVRPTATAVGKGQVLDEHELLALARSTMIATRSNDDTKGLRAPTVEVTLGEEAAVDLICFPFVTKKTSAAVEAGEASCTFCENKRAHICLGACGGSVNAALGGKLFCRKPSACRFHHPSAQEVKDLLGAWWRQTRGTEPLWGTRNAGSKTTTITADARTKHHHNSDGRHGRHDDGEMMTAQHSRSSATSAEAATGAAAAGASSSFPPVAEDEPASSESAAQRCNVPDAVLLQRLSKHAAQSAHVSRFLGEPFLRDVLADERLRPLLAMRHCAKEVSEAYGAAAQVVTVLRALGRPVGGGSGSARSGVSADGDGVAILDVCSGKGLTSVVLSYLLPKARITLFDANPDMGLAHVAARPQLRFVECDLFARHARAQLEEAALAAGGEGGGEGGGGGGGGGGVCVAIGTHLCGSLSPRLLDLALQTPAIRGLVLSPCCLRGSLGAKIGRTGKARREDPYRILVHTFAALIRDELRVAPAPPPPPPSGPPATEEEVVEEGEEEPRKKQQKRDGPVADVAPLPPSAEAQPNDESVPRCAPCESDEQGERPATTAPAAAAAARDGRFVRVVWDEAVLSPKNAFLVVAKGPSI